MTPRTRYWLRPQFIVLMLASSAAGFFIVPPPYSLEEVAVIRWAVFIAVIATVIALARFFATKPIKIRCPACRKIVLSDLPWVCPWPWCKTQNLNTRHFSFLKACEKCGKLPTAFRCHYEGCGIPIPLTRDNDDSYIARKAGDDDAEVSLSKIDDILRDPKIRPLKPAAETLDEVSEQLTKLAMVKAKQEVFERADWELNKVKTQKASEKTTRSGSDGNVGWEVALENRVRELLAKDVAVHAIRGKLAIEIRNSTKIPEDDKELHLTALERIIDRLQ